MIDAMQASEIPDPGLRLGVLNALLLLGQLDAGRLQERLLGIAKAGLEEPRTHLDAWIAEAICRLGDVEIEPAQLSAIRCLHFDGGNEIYMLIERALGLDTGGETGHYQVGSLAGVERLSGLQELDLDGHGFREAAIDLAPLRGHPSLRRVVLSGRCGDARALLQLPALVEVDVMLAQLDDEQAMDLLVSRGVDVQGRRT